MSERIDLVAAAQRLGVPYNTAHRWALIGRLDAERREGRWAVTPESIDRVCREQQAAAESPQ